MKYFEIDRHSLPAQMILSFIALVLLTAAAVGIPAIWLIRNQLERQVWAQVEQGSRAAQALYAAHQNELISLARLTAQRPTLRHLLIQAEQSSLRAYLQTLQAGTGLDLIQICTPDRQIMAQTVAANSNTLCTTTTPVGFHITPAEPVPQVWLFAAQSIQDRPEWVIVGIALDDEFARQMQAETGLEHTLLVANQPVATSLDALLSRNALVTAVGDDSSRRAFTTNNRPYYAHEFPLADTVTGETFGLEAEVALVATNIAATQQKLVWAMGGSIVAVVAGSSILGALLARRISRPLARLAKTAAALSQGNLDLPVAAETRVRELVLVAQALEQARIDLKRTLTDLRHEKAWTDHLLESIVEGIMTLDPHGRIIFFSPGAERITGWRREEVLHHSCDDLFKLVETEEPFSTFIPASGRQQKVTVTLASERQATLSITGAQLGPPEADAQLALVFRDVSEAEAVHRLIGHFLANVSHEFRTPLSALAASIELLMDQAPDLNIAELQELLTNLHLGILGLQRLVDNLLQSASIEAGRFRVNVHPSHLGEIMAEAIGTMQPLLNKHGQSLVLELPVAIPPVRADRRRTVQVLVNLLANASKYGPDEAEITLGATVNKELVRVTVADRGPGVPPAYRKNLFRRFIYPATGDDKTHFGAGLGLSVVKAIVEAQGGQVGVEDRPGGGLVFWFTLPTEDE